MSHFWIQFFSIYIPTLKELQNLFEYVHLLNILLREEEGVESLNLHSTVESIDQQLWVDKWELEDMPKSLYYYM